jgi:hypothetical protein
MVRARQVLACVRVMEPELVRQGATYMEIIRIQMSVVYEALP